MTNTEKLDLVEKFGAAAVAAQEKFDVPASVMIAQAILESKWMSAGDVQRTKNVFHIAVGRMPADYDEKPRPGTRQFRSLRECFLRHAELLAEMDRYQPAMAVADDPLAFAIELQRCGYSAAPDYPSRLSRLIAQYKLARFDAIAQQLTNKTKQTAKGVRK